MRMEGFSWARICTELGAQEPARSGMVYLDAPVAIATVGQAVGQSHRFDGDWQRLKQA